MKILSLFGLGLLVAGCVETTAQQNPEPQTPHRSNMARRDGISPRGASVAIADVQGVSPSVAERLSRAFEQQAHGRELNLANAETANYLVRGYLNTTPVEGGASFAFIWDVYDAKKHRTQRVDDHVVVKGAAANLDAIDDAALSLIAATSAEDLAAVLSNTPEAVAAASSPAAKNVSIARSPDHETTRFAGSAPAVAATVPQDTGIGMAAALH